MVYRITRTFPDAERYNLSSQIRRSAVSIPSNIAEGHGRKTDRDFAQFLRVAFGSSSELETQLLIALRLKLLSKTEYDEVIELLTHVRKMLSSLIAKTKNG